MSEPRLVYPLLNGFILGDAISEHNGVRCYPAIRHKSGEKYIVKVISIPASRVQLEALLLAGAFSGKDDALRYFKELAADKVCEAETLLHLSQQEGFVSYQDSQIVTSPDGDGYEVYLLSAFRQSAEKIFSANNMTHRGVVELGLDLCAALAACRRAGYLYVDLKPGNIFYTEDQGYRIGDIGFVPLQSLQFTPLQNFYHSCYTAPEMADDFAVLNSTLDIYALGLVLYQACNGGILPEGADVSAPPLYADYELAQIIAKACAPDPADRWQEPSQIAQALIGYMQQVGVTDAPLIPAPIEDAPADVEAFLPEATEEELAREMALLPPEDALLHALQADLTSEEMAQTPAPENLAEILAQADDLICHTLPAPPIAPEPIELPMPEPILPEPEPLPAPEPEPEPLPVQEPEPAPLDQTPASIMDDSAPLSPAAPSQPEEDERHRRPFPWRAVLGILLAALLLFAMHQARQYYEQVYIQTIDDLIINQIDDTVTVKVLSGIDESMLTVICTDSYGNSQSSPVTAGIAMFTGLQPQTRYTIRVQISGSHKLVGETSSSFTTPDQTQILTFTACIGETDGSVLLTLTTSGPEVSTWTLTYYADGVEPQQTTFTGTHTTVEGLQPGKDYTFVLSADDRTLGGVTETNFTATDIILAQNLTVTACGNGSLRVQWNEPEGYVAVNGWAVRCYDGSGFSETILTYEPNYTFTGMDHSTACTVEVTAAGMFQSVSTTVCANPITISSFSFAVSQENGLTLRWDFSGNAPEGGWIIDYTLDGIACTITASEPTVTVRALPGGSYCFTVSAASGVTVFDGTTEYTISEVGSFSGYGINAEALTASLTDSAFVLSAPEETEIEAAEDAIEILWILHSADGILLDISSTEAVWAQLWEDNICTLAPPCLPADPGAYRLSLYFAGGLVAQLEFSVE